MAKSQSMNVGVPILEPLAGPPNTQWSRSNSPTSEPNSPGRGLRPGSPKWRGSPDVDKEPLFPPPPGRVMVQELTEQSKLAREAAFELLLARAPQQAAAQQAGSRIVTVWICWIHLLDFVTVHVSNMFYGVFLCYLIPCFGG